MELVTNTTEDTATEETVTAESLHVPSDLQIALSKTFTRTLDLDENTISNMTDSLKDIADIHQKYYKENSVICTKLGYLHAAFSDVIQFTKDIMEGKEDFAPIPPKPELKPEDTELFQDEEGETFVKKVPSDLKNQEYVKEWFSTFFFPKLHEMLGKDFKGELSVNATFDEKQELYLNFYCTYPNSKEEVILSDVYAGGSINLSYMVQSCNANATSEK